MTARRPGILFLALILLLCAGAAVYGQTPTVTSQAETVATSDSPTPEVEVETEGSETETTEETTEEAGDPGDVGSFQPPEPEVTPGIVSDIVADLTEQTGLENVSILGLDAEDWISLVFAILTILAGYLFGAWLIRRLLPRIVSRTPTDFDDNLLAATGVELRWLIVILFVWFVIVRLAFLSVGIKTIAQSILFVVAFAIVLHVFWKSITVAEAWVNRSLAETGREDELAPVVKLSVILARLFIFVIGISVLLSYFGFDVVVLAATLGIGGLAFSLAARDTIADIIAGITILIDRPFRIGDRIEIAALDTWGDVVNIGLRSTRVRTRDNRMVIVPNSSIVANEVVNYTYPDSRYRTQTHVGVAYGSDIEAARQLIVDAVRQVNGVLEDKPVDALYNEMGDSAMVFRVRWWIESYTDSRRVLDRVHTRLQGVLDANGIDMPYPTASRLVALEPESVVELAQALRNENGSSTK